jgi:uncharacterized protein YeaO (DUF488 family)
MASALLLLGDRCSIMIGNIVWRRDSPHNRRSSMSSRRKTVCLKRAYDEPSKDDGVRILVERLWPRGVSKQKAAIDVWLREIAPSPELRKWYGHDVSKWDEFRRRYRAELDQRGTLIDELKQKLGDGPATFVFAAKDPEHSSALVLKEYVEDRK